MRSIRSWSSPAGPGPLAVFLIAATSALPASAGEFPEVAQLPARAELPDPLVLFDGRPVTSREQWVDRRRPELKALFQHYMYGQMPPAPANPTFEVAREVRGFLDGKATLKEVTI